MRRSLSLTERFALTAAAAVAAWGLWTWLELGPDETTRLRDDAFYEFAWAANVVTGRGPTVSDGVTTSGVQYLWTWLLTPFAWCFGALSLPLVAPWLGLGLHVTNAALWLRLAHDRFAGACLALCWLGHPLLLREAQNGQETALATLLATLLFAARNARARFLLPAALLAVFARSDLTALAVLLLVIRFARTPTRLLAGLALVVGAPLVVNALLGGGLLQDSAMPMSWLFHENLLAVPGADFWQLQWWYTRPALLGGPFSLVSAFGFGFIAFLLIRPFWPVPLRAVPAIVVGCASALGVHDLLAAGWCALLLALFPTWNLRRASAERLAVCLGLVAIVVLHWPLRWYPRDYYLAPLAVVAFAAIARFARFRLLLLVFAATQLVDARRVRPEPLAPQRELQMAGRHLHEVLPVGERVGCFNSGLVTFWADVCAAGGARRGVVNLDGVVDHRSFAALKAGRLSAWLDEQGVRFLLDNPVQFSLDPSLPHASGRYFGGGFDPARDLVELARFDVPGVGADMRLFWRRSAGEAPRPVIAPGQVRRLDGGRWPACALWGARAGERLCAETADGVRHELLVADADTAIVLELPVAVRGDGVRLVVEGP